VERRHSAQHSIVSDSQFPNWGEAHVFRRLPASRLPLCSWKTRHFWLLAVAALVAAPTAQSLAQAPAVTLTQVGSPIWRPVDFQMFTAPAEPEEAFDATIATIAPLDPIGVTSYTTPHGPPYDAELSINASAAGFVNRTVFTREDINANPNGAFIVFMLVPDPGVIGSSRDFASGPVIPHSVFPLVGDIEVWKDGALSLDQGQGQADIRPTDEPFDGASHRFGFSSYWNRGANSLGNYEFRWSLLDSQGNGWEIVAPFEVVAELPPLVGDFNQDGAADAADYVIWRNGLGTTYTQDDYNAWRAGFGRVSGASAALNIPNSLPTVPEPSALGIACIAAIGIGVAARRTSRSQSLRNYCQYPQPGEGDASVTFSRLSSLTSFDFTSG
jgi:hypothetical protein